ncbi:MAG: HD domain-containing protein, partial [Candidatus Hydrogenedentes bacterium]|nr:HD domain-containing protein [Candidatus Hydrogenedentota bacterium]
MSTDFAQEILELFRIIHPLDRIPRAGYVLRGVTDPESVSAHSHFLGVLALLFLERFPGTWDAGKVLAMALVHDLPEARLMDIAMPYADAYLRHAKAAAEQEIADHLFETVAPRLAELHREFCAAETPEARLLRGLDKAQMMIKVHCYEREHRGHLEEFWQNPKNFNDYGIGPVSALFDAICTASA